MSEASEAKFKVGEVVQTNVGLGRVMEIDLRKAGKSEIVVYSVLVGGDSEAKLFTENRLRKVK